VTSENGTRKNPFTFIDWADAFACCRDLDRPIIVAVTDPGGEFDDPDGPGTITLPDETTISKIFPSGRSEDLS